MNTFKYFIAALLMFIVTLNLVSCRDDMDHEYFLIEIDSISVPEIIRVNEPFDVKFFGNIGSNGCYSFDRFIMDEGNDTLIVEVWGKYKRGVDSCPTAEVEMNGKKINCTLDTSGNHLLIIKKPDGTYAEHLLSAQ